MKYKLTFSGPDLGFFPDVVICKEDAIQKEIKEYKTLDFWLVEITLVKAPVYEGEGRDEFNAYLDYLDRKMNDILRDELSERREVEAA